MKQYTNESQTAKLIELGFEKPSNTQYIQRAKARNLHSPFIEFGEPEFEGSYSIGELIEMLPKHIEIKSQWCRLDIYPTKNKWHINYEEIVFESPVKTYEIELIDALYDMVIMLKEEGII